MLKNFPYGSVLFLLGLASFVVGWIANIVWLFSHYAHSTALSTEFWVALAGVPIAIIGAIHGLIVLF